VAHLHDLPLPGAERSEPGAGAARRAWEATRLDRMLMDHWLREGEHALAEGLAAQAGIEPLTDVDAFRETQEIVRALRRRDCAPALAWCAGNRGRAVQVEPIKPMLKAPGTLAL